MAFKKEKKKVEMLEIAESQIRQWLPNVRADILDSVVSSIIQHIEGSESYKKDNSLSIRFDQHPPKWLQEIYIEEHLDYAHAVSGNKQIHLDFNELTVHCHTLPERPQIIYDGYCRKSVPL